MKRRILCIFLTLCMILSMIPSSAFAEEVSAKLVDGSETLRQEWLKYKESLKENTDENIKQIAESATPSAITATTPSAITAATPSAIKARLMPSLPTTPSVVSLKRTLQTTSTTNRYTVLVLDISGSMSGTPIYTMKAAASKFCEEVLKADGNNQVAIVTYSTYGNTVCEFTNNLTTLQNAITGLYDQNMTNTNIGLLYADKLLSEIPDEKGTIKNILLLSDGMPNEGNYIYSGRYTYDDYYYYQYANATYDTAVSLHNKGYFLYTLGFFHGLYGEELAFARKFMNDLQNAGYYDVVNAADLEFVFGEIAKEILKKTGTFRYQSGVSDYDAVYYYSDEYFLNDSYDYNESLATMSLCLAMSAFATSLDVPYTQKSVNVLDLLEQVGFQGFKTNYWYTVKPTRDSIGAVAAMKEIEVKKKPYTLIAVAVRGGGYESEWASNFTIGETGQHQGFNEARDNVLDFIRNYISENGITGDIKLWITGYSRAAATTNLVAGALDEGANLGSCVLNLSDLYAYCFETPAGAIAADARSNPVYKNIFNIVNYNDPVTKVAPATMGFRRYGVDKRLPDPLLDKNYPTKRDDMISKYNALPSTKGYIIDNFAMKKISVDISVFPSLSISPTIVDDTKNQVIQGAFLDTFISKMVKEQIKSRSNYVQKYQGGVREIFGVLNGTEDEQWSDFKKIFEDKLKSNVGWIIVSTTPIGAQFTGSTTELIEKYAVESINEAKITNYDVNQINALAATLAATVVEFAVSHPNLTVTLVSNLESMAAAHYPELCLAWLQSMDKNYTTNAGEAFSNGAYRIIRINCPVDVEVLDAAGSVVATITGDTPQSVTGSSIIASFNEDGEKLVYLPADTDFSINLTATGAGLMSYSINEFNCDAGDIVRIIVYNDIPIVQGSTFTSNIPAYSSEDLSDGTEGGSATAYALLSADGTPIPSSTDLSGDAATQAYYMVTAFPNNKNYGYVTGQGIRQLGNYAVVKAVPYDGSKFEGWYDNNKLVTAETEYRLRVETDITLEARFSLITTPIIFQGIPEISPITGVASGAAKTAAALGLPDSISIDTSAGRKTANVTWDVTSSSYDQSSKAAQTFTVNGMITLPAGVVNTNNVSLAVTIQVSVSKSSGSGSSSGSGAGSYSPIVKLPTIKDSNTGGWDQIIKYVTDNSKNTTIITNGNVIVPKKLFEVIRERDVTLTFILDNGIEWSVNGKDIPKDTEPMKLNDLDLSASLDKNNLPEDRVNKLGGLDNQQLILAKQTGANFKLTVRLPLKKDYSDKYANLFYYDKDTNNLSLQTFGRINENGYAEFEVTEFKNYIININDTIAFEDVLNEIKVTPAKCTLYIAGTTGNKVTLNAEIPEVIRKAVTVGYCDFQITYTSSDSKIATVNDSGIVKAKKKGKAIITTTFTVNGKKISRSTLVTVKKAYIKMTQSTDTLKVGEKFTFKAEGYGVDTKDIVFTTTKSSIVTINGSTGKAKAVSRGTDYVVAKVGDTKVMFMVVVK